MDPSAGRNAGVRSEINVTPLVDVCLVLLIIFMVVTPLLGTGAAELPETNRPQRMAERSEDVVLVVEQNLRTVVDEKPVAATGLAATLREIHSRAPARQLVVKADRRLPYGKVREVLRAAQQGGFAGAGLAVRARMPSATGPTERSAP
jgi:biopolymer transport protein TolR